MALLTVNFVVDHLNIGIGTTYFSESPESDKEEEKICTTF
jgi:hypothetical protein